MDGSADALRDIADPGERARRASALIDELASESGVASAVRLEALAEMQSAGMNQSEIARAAGMSRARISQVMRTAPPPGAPLLAPDAGPVIISMIEKRDADTGRATITRTTMKARDKLTDLAASFDLRAGYEEIPVPGMVNLNRPNLAVLIGPRSSVLVAQAISADPVIRWQPDDFGDWYFTDAKTGTEYRSEFGKDWRGDREPQTCYAHIGRVRRPDGQGSWLCLAGQHAPGVAGAADLFCRDIASLWETAHRSLWSAVVKVTADESCVPVESVLVSPVYVHGRR
jgi:transcriptional regulator with XRE-family HTH domain